MRVSVTVGCCLCEAEHRTTIEMPAGWEHRYGGIDDENSGFCPVHAKVGAFAAAQCPGCVGGWGDCPMWEAFAYGGRRRTVGAEDFAALESGRCPRRVNGTIGVNISHGGAVIEDLNISDLATKEAGAAFAQAIRDYCAKYPSN